MKVLVRETQACYVDFYHEVDCDGDAIEAVQSGDYDYIGCVIKDNVDCHDPCFDIVDSLPCNIREG